MHEFEDTEQVVHQLERLIARGLAVLIPRQAGQREDRYTHALGDPADIEAIMAARQNPLIAAQAVACQSSASKSWRRGSPRWKNAWPAWNKHTKPRSLRLLAIAVWSVKYDVTDTPLSRAGEGLQGIYVLLAIPVINAILLLRHGDKA